MTSGLTGFGLMIVCKHSCKLKLSGATAHEGQGLLCPSQYTRSLCAEMHEHKSRSGGQSEVRPPAFKSPSRLGTPLSIHCSRDERLSRPRPSRETFIQL
ncbi:uncharacterized protein TNCV_195041 [Trichonephila clavipes]|uniref:Uncharacterized protein n=1 Tax=Trichonephila clavipes TaxID=2585209 RepID=A0A8X6WKE2_TRICX|nr:uncharacterized protein TNCV_195041 [Trichonephila clavipes]